MRYYLEIKEKLDYSSWLHTYISQICLLHVCSTSVISSYKLEMALGVYVRSDTFLMSLNSYIRVVSFYIG